KNDRGDVDGAIADLNRAIELNPKFVLAYCNRSSSKETKGDLDGALADCNRAAELDPTCALAYVNRGLVKRKKGDLDGSLAECNRAIELDPKCAHAYIIRSPAKMFKGDLAGAIADYTRALELVPYNCSVYSNRGTVYFMQHNWTNALADFRRCGELNPRWQDLSQLSIWLTRTRLGEKGAATKELAAYLEKRWKGARNNWDDWRIKIAAFLLDKTSESDLISAAASPDIMKGRQQLCEGWYYAGMKRLLADDKATAANCFRKCETTKAVEFMEYHLAQAELKALAAK
ncbi:MAG: tetratricopeptide repeat protein, partial [Verrucomicrobia bacterium]|nr:tetratricopeptide repeat protein [Verrucomicrobiota bacterium]